MQPLCRVARAPRALLLAALLVAAAGCAAAARMSPPAHANRAKRHSDGKLRILAIGDSITQGSVPSLNDNHPYTIQLQKRLEAKLGQKVEVVNGGVGGAGIFAVGFHNPVTLVPWARSLISKERYDWVISLVGINDLLRVGKPADEVMKGLLKIYKPALERGANVLAIAPLPAPGFVSQSDYKEAERLKLSDDIGRAAEWWNSRHANGPSVLQLDLGVTGPMDFWKMDQQQRAQWLDDGLHLTQKGYDRMGDLIADALIPRLSASQQ